IETVPPATRSVLFKYLLNSSAAGSDACSIYALRMEVNHQPSDSQFKPLLATFNWSERQGDYSLVERSHTELVTKLPHRYTSDVGGADHPLVNWLKIGPQNESVAGAASSDAQPFSLSPHGQRAGVRGDWAARLGYSDGKDAGGEKFVSRWVTCGKNFARGK